jgi:HicB family
VSGVRLRTKVSYHINKGKMTIRVKLNPDVEARLVAEASAQGISLEKLAERILHEAVASRSLLQRNLSVDDFHEMLKSLAIGSEGLPNLRTESFTRESFYEDRP